MMDELPLLTVLQNRKPDVYDPAWMCLLCKNSKEDFSHIWLCDAIHLSITRFHKEALEIFFNNFEAVYGSRLPTSFITQWTSLPSLSLPSSTHADFSFDYLIKGFVPTELVTCLQSFFPKKIANDVLLISLCSIKKLFIKRIWHLRCREFTNIEQSLNITSDSKRSVSSSSGTQHIAHSSNLPIPSLLNRWKVWIARAIGSGSPWMGFPLYINGLIS
jgi:hypothetical protein